MGLPFEGMVDEVKAHLDAVTGVTTDLLTNLNNYLADLLFTGAIEDKIKAWLVSQTGESPAFSSDDLLRIYLTGLGYTQPTLTDALAAAVLDGGLFGPVPTIQFVVTDAGGSNFMTSDGKNFTVREN